MPTSRKLKARPFRATPQKQLRSEEEERRRRALFFDPADLDIGEPGVPCDHLARSKPQAIAGPTYVVILGSQGSDKDRIRVWIAIGDARSADEAIRKAHDLANRRREDSAHVLIDSQRYFACH